MTATGKMLGTRGFPGNQNEATRAHVEYLEHQVRQTQHESVAEAHAVLLGVRPFIDDEGRVRLHRNDAERLIDILRRRE